MFARFFLLAVLASTSVAHAGPALTIAAQTDKGLMAMTYDGETARVYTDGQLVSSEPAATALAAMWSMPSTPATTGMRKFQRALSSSEIVELDTCEWPDADTMTDCVTNDCGCTNAIDATLMATTSSI